MKIHSFVALVTAASAANLPAVIFYANISNKLEPLAREWLPHLCYFCLKDPWHPEPPQFTLNNGVATIGDGSHKKTLGISEDFISYGKEHQPFYIQLDNDSKVLGIDPYVCKRKNWRHRGHIRTKNHTERNIFCYPTDIYLLTVDGRALPEGKLVKDGKILRDGKLVPERSIPKKPSSESVPKPLAESVPKPSSESVPKPLSESVPKPLSESVPEKPSPEPVPEKLPDSSKKKEQNSSPLYFFWTSNWAHRVDSNCCALP